MEGETKAQRLRASPTASVRPGHRPQPQPWSLHRDLECGLPSSVPQQRTLQARWDPHQQASPHLNWTWGLDGGGQVETRPHWGRRALISLLTLRWEQNTETQEPVETRQRPDGCGLKPRNPGAPTPGWERQEGPSPTDLRGEGPWPTAAWFETLASRTGGEHVSLVLSCWLEVFCWGRPRTMTDLQQPVR